MSGAPARGERRDRPLSVFGFDPSLGRGFGNHLSLRLPFEPVEPGPVGRYLTVDDPQYGAVDLEHPSILLAGGLAPSEFDACFHQQMAYAVATHTIDQFQNALGRALHWPWDGRLRLVPHSDAHDTAVFDRDDGTIYFGHLPAPPSVGLPGQRIYACLSFDLTMSAVVRALLSAMGRDDAGDGWVAGISTLLPLLHHFTRADAVLETIQRSGGRLHDKTFLPDVVARAAGPAIQAEVAARNPLLQMAPQFSEARGVSASLRTALDAAPGTVDLATLTNPEEHGAVLVAAVFDAFFTVYTQRSADLLRITEPSPSAADLHPDLAQRMAREAVKTARRFLIGCMRAIDYCPPGPIRLGTYLRALVTVSDDFSPEQVDERLAAVNAFRARGIIPEGARSYDEDGVRWPSVAGCVPERNAGDRVCAGLRFETGTAREQKANARTLVEFLRDRADVPIFDRDRRIRVDHLPDRLSERLASNGSVLREAVAMVSQPGGVRATVLIDDDGALRYVISDTMLNVGNEADTMLNVGNEADTVQAPGAGGDPLQVAPPPQAPRVRPLVVYAFDPSQGQQFGNVLTIHVPYEPVEPGPIGDLLAVIDYDAPNDRYYEPVDLDDPGALGGGLELRDDDPRFHQQMVYAVASETIRRFEFALGRKVKWPWVRRNRKDPIANRLRVLPHAFQEPNAYYDREVGSLLFGYFLSQPGNEVVFTCLSHDIVAHETTHALVDTVRPLLLAPTGPDALAFHEAFADIVALLQHFSFREALYETVLRTGGRIHAGRLEPEVKADNDGGPTIQAELTPKNPLVEVAKQFGEAMGMRQALRQAIGTKPDEHRLGTVIEPHERGSILVAAVFDAFFTVYVRRTADLLRLARAGRGITPWGDLHPDLAMRLTREAAKSARHFLTMCVRALDYLPPVDVTFGDFLRAVLTSDADIVPDDPWKYRAAFIDAFRSRGIRTEGISGTSEAALRWPLIEDDLWITSDDGVPPFSGTPSDVAKRLHAFATLHAERLGLDPALPVQAQQFHLQDSRRVDPSSGLRQREFVAQFVQKQEVPVDPTDPGGRTFTYRGGSTVLFWADGRVRYVMSRPFADEVRALRQRDYERHLRMNLAAAPFSAAVNDAEPTLARLHRGW